MIPTPEQFLAKLEASPADGAAFDKATHRERPHCKTRRDAVEAVLNAVRATIAESAALKTKLAASRAKISALEVAKLKNQRLRAELTLSKNRSATAEARIATAKALAPVSLTPLADKLAKLQGAERSTFYQANARAIRREEMCLRSPASIIN